MFVFKSNHGASHSRINLVTFFQAIKNPQQVRVFYNMAESEGFEPPVGLTLRLISSQVH
jgi:hypothetical protein